MTITTAAPPQNIFTATFPGNSVDEDVPYEAQVAALAAMTDNKTKKLLDKYPDAPVLELPSKRRIIQPKFKHRLDTLHDFEIRVRRTVIYIGSMPYYVDAIMEYKQEFWLIVLGWDGEFFKIPYGHPAVDLRNPEPQYLALDRGPYYLMRWPSREQPQGIHSRNTTLKPVGSDQWSRIENFCDVLAGLRNSDNLPWSGTFQHLMQNRVFKSVRLSPNVSVYRGSDDSLCVEYKGRDLGGLNDDEVSVDDEDFDQPWVRRDVSMVGLKLRRQ